MKLNKPKFNKGDVISVVNDVNIYYTYIGIVDGIYETTLANNYVYKCTIFAKGVRENTRIPMLANFLESEIDYFMPTRLWKVVLEDLDTMSYILSNNSIGNEEDVEYCTTYKEFLEKLKKDINKKFN